MVAIKPQKRTTFGKDSWGFAPLIANIATPTLTELDAAAGLNLSCYLVAEQEGLTGNTEKVTLTRALCETTQFEFTGATTFSMSDLTAFFDPQAAAGSDGKKAWETLDDGLAGFLWRRLTIASADDLEVGQFVDIVPVQLGVKIPGKTANDAGGVASFTQSVAVSDSPAFNVAIIAGA